MLKGQFEVFSLLNLDLNDYAQFLCSQVHSGIRKHQCANPFIQISFSSVSRVKYTHMVFMQELLQLGTNCAVGKFPHFYFHLAAVIETECFSCKNALNFPERQFLIFFDKFIIKQELQYCIFGPFNQLKPLLQQLQPPSPWVRCYKLCTPGFRHIPLHILSGWMTVGEQPFSHGCRGV